MMHLFDSPFQRGCFKVKVFAIVPSAKVARDLV